MWKLALNKFLERYKDNPHLEAIFLVGSYAVGNENEYSDIDVYIVFDDEVEYQERGNIQVDNYLFEFFANPIYKVKEFMYKDKRDHGGPMANMILNGKVLYDKHSIVDNLKQEALAAIKKNPEYDPMYYYRCWCAYDEYLAAQYHSELQYYQCLQYLVEAYLIHNGYLILPEAKIERFFKDEEYRVKYNIGNFPNNEFNILVINCFDNPNKDNLEKLYNYVINDGKFDINNFVLRKELKKE